MVSARGNPIMESQHIPSAASSKPLAGELVRPYRGTRYENIKADARRRRLMANAVVVGSTAAVLALAVVFNALLSR